MRTLDESRDTPFPVRIQGCFPGDEAVSAPLLAPSLAVQGFSAHAGQTAVLPEGDGVVVHIGLGARESCDVETARRSLASCRLPVGRLLASNVVQQLSEVMPRTSAARVATAAWAELGLTVEESASTHSPLDDSLTHGVLLGRLEAEAVIAAKRWTNASAAELPPLAFAHEAEDIAAREGLTIEVLGPDALVAQGFGGLVGVGAGSPHSAHLVDLRFEPADARAHLCLVGKGVTFDTGGLSLKSPAAMSSMRSDKAGAAAVLAVMSVVARLGLPLAVRALIPLAENMIGPSALRPGDVVTARNGTRIQVMDTDFEGRVILADALAYACEENPDVLIDIATLTYQVVTALGPEIGGLITRTDPLAIAIEQAGSAAGEPLWRLPYADRYRGDVVTADGVKNHPESDSGRALTAAVFLGQFVPTSIAWAHLDISGPAWKGKASDAGATAFGVRTLLQLFQMLAADSAMGSHGEAG